MSLAQRLQRLETLERERSLREIAERLAAQYGVPVDETLRDLWEVAARIDRWGIDEELRHFAREHGISEDEVRARYEAEVAALEDDTLQVVEL